MALRNLVVSRAALQFDMADEVAEKTPHPQKFMPGPMYRVTVALPEDVGPGPMASDAAPPDAEAQAGTGGPG